MAKIDGGAGSDFLLGTNSADEIVSGNGNEGDDRLEGNLKKISSCLMSVTFIGFLLGSVFGAAPALGAILTRQEFEGVTLVDANSLLRNTLPDSSEYSGFVVYEEDGTLSDWEVNVDELDLNLNPNLL